MSGFGTPNALGAPDCLESAYTACTPNRLISPDGKTQFDAPAFSRTIAADTRAPSVIVLNPVMDYTLDSNDLPGIYTVRVTITDRVHSVYAKAEEQFQLIQQSSARAEQP